MPSAVTEIPQELLALVVDLLKKAGHNKTAKKLEKDIDDELPECRDDLLEIYNQHMATKESTKKRKKAAEVVVEEEPAEEEPAEEEQPKKKSKKDSKKDKKQAKKEEVEEVEEEEETPKEKKKKEKRNKKEKAEEEEEEEEEEAPATPAAGKTNSGGKKSGEKQFFQRIKEEDVEYLKVHGGRDEAERLKDNTFESKGGDVYGAKASSILMQVRGKDFRHEKTKKKRGTYKGGPIDMGSNSVKFVDSDED